MSGPLFELGRVFDVSDDHFPGRMRQVVRWLDYYGRDCILMTSRLRGDYFSYSERHSRNRCSEPQFLEVHICIGRDKFTKMVLNRPQVSDLINHLQCWLDNGHYDFNKESLVRGPIAEEWD